MPPHDGREGGWMRLVHHKGRAEVGGVGASAHLVEVDQAPVLVPDTLLDTQHSGPCGFSSVLCLHLLLFGRQVGEEGDPDLVVAGLDGAEVGPGLAVLGSDLRVDVHLDRLGIVYFPSIPITFKSIFVPR
jgi:hypothetical protein